MDDAAKNAGIDRNLSHRLRLALTADKDELFQVMQEQSAEALLAALRNPALDEHHLLALLARRGVPAEVFRALHTGTHLPEAYPVRLALACHPETPAHIALALLPQLYLFDLLKICTIPGIGQDQRLAAERTIIQRLPAQPLGNKLTLARRGTAAVVEALLREGVPPVVEACLDNPRLREGTLYQFINSAASTAETISMIARSGRWKGRPGIRLAILKNPRTPAIWFTLFLPGLPTPTLREILAAPRLSTAQKELVRQAMGSRGGTR
ncbi:MAG TPA: hypothetical protein VF795_10460 [Desulfuromonadaceae bacterium]